MPPLVKKYGLRVVRVVVDGVGKVSVGDGDGFTAGGRSAFYAGMDVNVL